MTEIDIHRLDAAYRPFPTFEDWLRTTSVDKVRWDRYTSAVEQRSKQAPAALDRARRIATRAAAIDTGALENLYEADRGFTYTVAFQTSAWESEIEARGEQVRPLFEAQLQGYEFVLSLATGSEPISEAAIRELHMQMCKAQVTYRVATAVGFQDQPLPKGQYKSLPNHVRTRNGEAHSYAPVDVTPEEMYRFVSEIRSEVFLTSHPVTQAAYAHFCFVTIHPFADGNGRVARALASAFTYRAISIPILILTEQKAAYLDSLEAADRGNYQSFVQFMMERALDTIQLVEESLKTAKAPSPKYNLETIEHLYSTRGGFTQEQVDSAGLSLSALFRDELSARLPKSSQPKISINFDAIQPVAITSASLRTTLSKQGSFMVSLRSAAPLAAISTKSFALWVPKDMNQEDDIQLLEVDGVEAFTARMSDLTPGPNGVTKLRMTMFAERIITEMISTLGERAEETRSNWG
jgi:Fic family protein